jgi:hypothetical protein
LAKRNNAVTIFPIIIDHLFFQAALFAIIKTAFIKVTNDQTVDTVVQTRPKNPNQVHFYCSKEQQMIEILAFLL